MTFDMNKTMSAEEILKNNKFANCSVDELKNYWEEMKQFYTCGWIDSDTPLGAMRDAYCKDYPAGIVIMEADFMRAVCVRTYEG